MRIATLFLAAAVSGFIPAIAFADNADAPNSAGAQAPAPTETQGFNTNNLSPEMRTEIESIIQNYLTKTNPGVVKSAAEEIARRDQAAAMQKSDAAITANKSRIFEDPNTPVAGNPKGDVTVVEFFDYQCGYCKMSEAGVEQLLKEDKNVKVIYKDFPILGPESTVAAHAAFAAIKQGKYMAFHDALMNKQEHLSDTVIYQAAKSAGMDVEKMKKDMADPTIDKMIETNIKLGMDIGVRGTPMFIINGQSIPGSMQYEQLKKNVDDARAGKLRTP